MTETSRTILAVEDENHMITLMKYNLEAAGYKFNSVKNGVEAIAFCRKFKPDLIISDIGMPEMDGYQLREYLLQDAQLAKIPFIFLSAKTQSEDLFRGMRLGVSHFLTKPFEPRLLIETVAAVLRRNT